MKALVLAALLVAIGWYGYTHSQRRTQVPLMEEPEITRPAVPEPRYVCDGRIHCSQMTSCAEATWFLRNCPGTKMDGDRDGIPCEQQWCP